MRNIIKTLAVAALMMSAVAAFAQMPGAGQKPGSNQRPSVQKVSSSDYTVRGTKVYYGRVELRDADYRTFVDLGHGYAKDNDNVWWNGSVLPYVDATSFRLTTHSGRPAQGPGSAPGMAPGYGPGATPGMGPGMAPGYGPGTTPGTPGHGMSAQPHMAKYEVIGNSVFFNGVKVKGARASSFKDLGWGYAMDTFDVYYLGEEIDASTMNFKVLTDGYAKNSFDVFYCGKEVKGASPSSFKVLEYGYAEDAFDTYYLGKEIDD